MIEKILKNLKIDYSIIKTKLENTADYQNL